MESTKLKSSHSRERERERPVRKSSCIKRTHVINFFQIDIAVQQLFIATVDNSWSIRRSKHMGCALWWECTKANWLGTKRNLKLVRNLHATCKLKSQHTCMRIPAEINCNRQCKGKTCICLSTLIEHTH